MKPSKWWTPERRQRLAQGIVNAYTVAWGPVKAERHFGGLRPRGVAVPDAPPSLRRRASGFVAGLLAGLLAGMLLAGSLLGLATASRGRIEGLLQRPRATAAAPRSAGEAPSVEKPAREGGR